MRIKKSPYLWLRKARTTLKLFLEVKERLPDEDWRTGKKKNIELKWRTSNLAVSKKWQSLTCSGIQIKQCSYFPLQCGKWLDMTSNCQRKATYINCHKGEAASMVALFKFWHKALALCNLFRSDIQNSKLTLPFFKWSVNWFFFILCCCWC